jgi:hypothetical protein
MPQEFGSDSLNDFCFVHGAVGISFVVRNLGLHRSPGSRGLLFFRPATTSAVTPFGRSLPSGSTSEDARSLTSSCYLAFARLIGQQSLADLRKLRICSFFFAQRLGQQLGRILKAQAFSKRRQ